MDVTPPSMLRRLGIALAGLAVAALTGAACVLSFDDLRALAVHGGGRADLAYLYPAAFDALLVVTLICVLLLRSARALVRAQATLVLVLLIVAAAAVNVATALSYPFPAAQTAVGVAVAPWLMLALGLWLWLLLIKHVRAGRDYARDDDGTREQDVVPFHRDDEPDRTPEPPRQAAAHRPDEDPPPLETITPGPLETTPVVGPTPAPETPPVPEPAVAPLSHPEPAPERSEPETGQADDASVPGTDSDDSEAEQSAPMTEPRTTQSTGSVPETEPDPAPEPEPKRPVRWGDRVKPRDVLVHPRTSRTADTQPVPVVQDDDPDPRHGPEAADPGEPVRDAPAADRQEDAAPQDQPERDPLEDTAPHPIVEENDPDGHRPPAEAPSGRLRSTPRPPED